MLKIWQHLFKDWLNGVEPLPPEERIAFKLMYGPREIGRLRAEGGQWVFKYSDEFRHDRFVNPIVDFPKLDKEYRCTTLWPFFALRIPSPEQANVREFIRKRPKEKVGEADLLKEFGSRSIANPFELVPVEEDDNGRF